MEKRFRAGRLKNAKVAHVIEGTYEEYNSKNTVAEQNAMTIVEIKIGGMVSEQLATQWCKEIQDQLNQFDIANAAVAKLT